jgi:gliding motility-associated-like protein
MKRSAFILLTSLAITLQFSFRAAYAALSVGDIAVIGWNSDPASSTKDFAVVVLASIASGETIYITDKGITLGAWQSDLATEGIFSWTTTSTIAAGTVIKFSVTSGLSPSVTSSPSVGTLSVTNGWSSTSTASPFGNNGDQIIIYQGTSGAPTFIFGYNSGINTIGITNGWNTGGSTANNYCEIPTGLTNGTNAVSHAGAGALDNYVYTGTTTGTKAALLAAICNSANWSSDDTTPYTFGPGAGQFPGTNPIFTLPSPNSAPTDISLSASTIDENVIANSTIGTLSSTDPDAGNTFTYTLVAGTGSTDNASFTISGSSLRITNSPDFETKSSYSVRVRTTDQGALTYEEAFVITINDLAEGVSLSTSPTLTFTSNAASITGDDIATDGEGGSQTISDINIQVYNISNTSGTLLSALSWQSNSFLGSNSGAYSGLTNEDNAGSKGMAIKSSDGSEFRLMQFTYYNWGETDPFTNTIKGYRNGSEVASTTFQGFDPEYDPTTIVLDGSFVNVDEVRFYISAGGYIGDQSATNHSINSIQVTTPTANSAPTDITLSASSINENVAGNSTVGTLSSTDPNAANTFTYTLVAGAGDTDNASFNISGSNLRITNNPDFETKSSYSVRVRTTDQGSLTYEEAFIITINNLNEAPSDIALSASSINENVAGNSTVGTLSSTDVDAANTFTYTLVAGAGDTDNASFNISGSNLRITNNPDFETKSSYSIRVRTTDQGSLTYEEAFTITINNLNETPSDMALSASSVDENVVGNTTVGTLSSTDVDAGNTFTYTIVAGAGDTDNASFNISGSNLRITNSPDFETKSSYSVRVRTTDQGSLTYEEAFIITINNLNETPSDMALSASSVDENVVGNTTVGTLSSTDVDAGNTFTYTIVAGTGDTDNASFNISGSNLRITNSPDFETKSSYSVRVRTTDQGSLTYEEAFIITINDVLENATISSINRQTPAGSIANTSTVEFSVIFNGGVTGVDVNDFSLTTTGVLGASITGISGSGNTYSITVNTGSGDGTIRVDLEGTPTITPTVTNAPYTSGQVYSIDKTAPSNPVIVAITTDSGASSSDGITNDQTLTISGTAEANAGITVSLTGTGVIGTTTADGSGNWSFNHTGTTLTTGNYTFTATATDNATNTSGSSTGFAVTIDITAPGAPTINAITTDTGSSSSDGITNDQTLTLSGTAEANTSVTVSRTGTGIIGTPTADGSGNWAFDYTGITLANGNYTFTATATDAAGNESGNSTDFTITIDTSAPTISSVSVPANGIYIAGQNLDFTVNLNENVTVNTTAGTPFINLVLTTGGTVQASYISGSGSGSLVFRYVVATGNIDNDGVSLSGSVSANGATLRDAAGNDLALTLNSIGSTTGVLVDGVIPTLSSVIIVSDNTNTSLAKPGDKITITLSASENINTPSVTIAGNAAILIGSGADYTATYTMANTDSEGVIPIIINFSDIAGNAGSAITTTTNSSSVTFDKTSPTASTVTLNSNNGNNTRAKVGDIVTVQVTSSEAIQLPTISIAGNAVTVNSTSSTQYNATYTMTVSDTEGLVGINISFKDLSGNNGTAVTTTTDASTVTFDKTVPTVSTVTIVSDNADNSKAKAGDNVTIAITASEAIAALVVTIAGHSVSTTTLSATHYTASYTLVISDNEGTVPFTIDMTDISGNTGTTVTNTTNSSSVTFDRTAPTLTTATIASNNSDNTKAKSGDVITVTIIAAEAIKAPVVTIAGNIANINTTSATEYSATYTMTGSDTEGVIGFNIAFEDVTGNTGTAVTTTTNSSSVTLDKTAPTLSSVQIASNNIDQTKAKTGDIITLTITASEAIFTPVITIAGNAAMIATVSTTQYTASYTMVNTDTEGIIPFTIGFSDVTNNAGISVTATTNSSSVTFDHTPPTGTININTGAVNASSQSVTLTVGSNDGSGTGVAAMRFSNDNNDWTNASWETVAASKNWTLPAGDGLKTVYIQLQDGAGNVSNTTISDDINLDMTPPEVTITTTAPDSVNTSYTVSFAFTEDVSGFDQSDIQVTNATTSNFTVMNASTYTVTITPQTDGEVNVSVNANACLDIATNGNLVSLELKRTYDITQPSVTVTTLAANPTHQPFIISITFSEGVNGFDLSDLTLTNGIASNLTKINAAEYTALITPSADGEVKVELTSSTVQDFATNANLASLPLTRLYDATAPQGYAINFNTPLVEVRNVNSITVSVSGAETGIHYFYTITSTNGGSSVTGDAIASAGQFDISNLNLTGLADGELTITFYMVDDASNQGNNATASVTKITRNIVSVKEPSVVNASIRTTFSQLNLPATVEVTYSNGETGMIAVTWAQGNYNAAVAAQYPLTGKLILAVSTTNIDSVKATIIVNVAENLPPTALALTKNTFAPDLTEQDAIGSFSTTDTDDTEHQYALVSGAGDADNALFEIRGNELFLKSNEGLSGATEFSIRVRSTDPYENTVEKAFNISKENYETTALQVPNTFSPNGDGINDGWTVPELKFYNNVELEVFDRSGVRLFHTTDPQATWDGKNQRGEVLLGAFFYIIKINDIQEVKKGVVIILN